MPLAPMTSEGYQVRQGRKSGLPLAPDSVTRAGVLTVLVKISIVLFLVFWLGFGAWLLLRFEKLFGFHPDDPAVTSGARALNQTQILSCWFGMFAVAVYFLFS